MLPDSNRKPYDMYEVIRRIADKPKPLAAYVFAKDRDAIDYFISRTTSGSLVVNHNVVQSGTNPLLPFGMSPVTFSCGGAACPTPPAR